MNDQNEMIRIFDSANDKDLRGGGPYENDQEEIFKFACHMLKWMSPKPLASIIELACGNGRVAACISEIRPDLDYSCMDICPTLTRKAQELNPKMKVHTGNCLKIIPYGKYDQIVSWGFAQYLSRDEFMNLNRMLLTRLNEEGEIWHFSIPDNTRRWSHNMTPRKNILSKAKGVVKYLIDSRRRYYGPASIWHDPRELKKAHEDSMIMHIIQPGDVDYRFHLLIRHKT